MEVYLVARGEYSDYEVLGVFSTEERAQAYIDAWDKDTYYMPFIGGMYYIDTLLNDIDWQET